MEYNHKDVIIFISKMISKVINWCIMLAFIIGMGLIIWGFYIFIVNPYGPGQDPVQKWWKERQEKQNRLNQRTYLNPTDVQKPFLHKNGLTVYLS